MDATNDTTILTKRCSRGSDCANLNGPELPADTQHFYRDKNKPDGLRSECKICMNRTLGHTPRPVVPAGFRRCAAGDKCVTEGGPILPAAEEYFSHDAGDKSGLSSRCRACTNIQSKEWQAAHPGRMKELQRASRKRNPERYAAKRRQHLQAHPEVRRTKEHRHNARRQSVPATFTATDWAFALDYWHGVCAYCGRGPRLFDYYWGLHQEHHIPLARGGPYTPQNILPACQECNLSKTDRDPHEWMLERSGKNRTAELERLFIAFFAAARQDNPSVETFTRKTRQERTAERHAAIAANPPSHKRCCRGEKCVNPEGPLLPATHDYFAYCKTNVDGFDVTCKMCIKNNYQKRQQAKRASKLPSQNNE